MTISCRGGCICFKSRTVTYHSTAQILEKAPAKRIWFDMKVSREVLRRGERSSLHGGSLVLVVERFLSFNPQSTQNAGSLKEHIVPLSDKTDGVNHI